MAMLGVFAFHGVAFAQSGIGAGAAQVAAASNLPTTSLPLIVARIIRAFIGVLGIIATVIILYAGFTYMTSGGDPDKTKRAKRMIVQAVIGLAIILSSYAIASFVINSILTATGAGGISGRSANNFIEPLSGSLGAGIIQDHYPPRNALAIPRNVKVFVTFKAPIDPASFPAGVKIAPTDSKNGPALDSAKDVAISHDDADTTFVFDPVPLLGSPTQDENYTVSLLPSIRKADGTLAFTGSDAQGYSWTFTVSTAADLTPPQVVSVEPVSGTQAPNVTIQIDFNEAMDPVASTGTFDPAAGKSFSNIQVSAGGTPVPGTYAIGNGYTTVEFTPQDACGKDRCGDTVFCLPLSANITAVEKAATVDGANAPQAKLFGVSYDGLVDAAGNSLDGNRDGKAEGPPGDSFSGPSFSTSATVDERTPTISAISPGLDQGNVSLDQDVDVTFSMPMKATTLNAQSLELWPQPAYPLWFVAGSVNLKAGQPAAPGDSPDATEGIIHHPTLLPPDVQGGPYFYYPLVTKDARGINQFCMYPPVGPLAPGTGTFDRELFPYTCDGVPSATACQTSSSPPLPLPEK
jgi:hypothetical protein